MRPFGELHTEQSHIEAKKVGPGVCCFHSGYTTCCLYCGTSGKLLMLSIPQFPHLSKENDSTCLAGLLRNIHKHFKECLACCKYTLNVSYKINFICTIYIIILMLG